MVGGKDLDVWRKEMIDAMVSWGKKIGATGIEVVGRKGWERYVKEL